MQTQILLSRWLDILIEMTGFYTSALYSTTACSWSRCSVYSFVKILYKFHASIMQFGWMADSLLFNPYRTNVENRVSS